MTMASTQKGIFAKMTTNKQSSPLSAILYLLGKLMKTIARSVKDTQSCGKNSQTLEFPVKLSKNELQFP
jgi:hypothetical protein